MHENPPLLKDGMRKCGLVKKLSAAADYISAQFNKTNARVEIQHFSTAAALSPDSKFRNLSAHFGPQEGARIVIGAHYDEPCKGSLHCQ